MKKEGTQETNIRQYGRKPGEQAFRRLQFFEEFMSLANVTMEDAAGALGLTRPSIHHWLQQDDARLNYLQKIIESFGYEFNIWLSREEEEISGKVPVRVEDFVRLPGEIYKPDSTAFLTVALQRYGISKLELSERLGLQYSTVRYWFSKDIMMSRIFQIAEACDFSVSISIRKKIKPEAKPKGRIDGKTQRRYNIIVQRETTIEI